MAFQNKLPAVPPQPFLANGTVDGQITIAQPGLFKVGQDVVIGSSVLPSLQAEIKRIASGIIFVGPIDNNPDSRLDISAYGAGSSFIFANEQLRPFIPKDELIPNFRLEDYEFEEEPVVARRSILVDTEGEKIGVVVVSGVRRLAVDTSVSISSVTVTQSGIQNVHVVDVVQVSGVAEQPVRVDGVVQVSGVAEQPVRVDNVVQVSGVVGIIQSVQTTVSGVVAVSGVATQTVFDNRQWLDVESLERQTSIRIDYSGISPIFIGEAPPGSLTSAPVWRIRQIVYAPGPNPVQIIWADGDTNFDNIWDNRASLSYS